MSSSGWWNVLLPVGVLGLWLTAACSNGIAPEATPVPEERIIDDDDFSSPPVLECGEDSPRGQPCRITGQIDTTVTVNYKNTPLRLAFYESSVLDDDGLPLAPDRYSEVASLTPPFTFPLPFEATVTAGRILIAEAWVDGNGNGIWDPPDLLGYSAPFVPEATQTLSISLAEVSEP